MLDRTTALDCVRRTLAAEYACDSSDFMRSATTIVRAAEQPGGRRFPQHRPRLAMATMGHGAVVTAEAQWLDWAQAELGDLDHDTLFSLKTLLRINAHVSASGQHLSGPDLRYICTSDQLRQLSPPSGVRLERIEQQDIERAYAHPGFHNAVCYTRDNPCPDVLALLAWDGPQMIGMAGASADSAELWQIGIDVLPAYRRSGIGKALVSQLTTAVIAAGAVPYYTTGPANIASANLARSVGYWRAWIEYTTRR